MARIVVLSKYPPIEGGIAAKTYWLSRSLAERGHTIHIVTNRINADPEYSIDPYEEELQLSNIIIHRPSVQIPWHIPNDHHVDMELLDCAVSVAKDITADIIDTGYLVPYGLIGYLASRITGIPFLLRHGGSDINKFLRAGLWDNLFKEAFSNASIVITDRANYDTVSKLSNRICVTVPYVPDPRSFQPLRPNQQGKPILALIGKTNYHWRHKGWHRAVDMMKLLQAEFKLLIVAQGIGFHEFRKYAEEKIDGDTEWRSFRHPFEMPELLNSIHGMFVLSGDLPFPAFSNLILEALYCGKAVITDQPDIFQSYKNEGLNIERFSTSIIQLSGNDSELAARTISDRFKALRNTSEKAQAIDRQDFQAYIGENEKAILSVL